MKLYKHIRIDLYNTLPMPVLEAQQNNIGRGVEITLTAGAEIVDPSDEEVNMYCKNPDGNLSYIPCSVVNGNIRAVFTNQMLAVPGTIQVELQIISGTDEITTPIFLLKVNPSNIDPEAIESQNEFTALQQALSELAYLKANGLKGDPGKAATLQIGTVTASAPGSDPVVTNSGTEQNAVLNFIIPRGEEGPTGPPISTVNPAEATEEDTGEAADAYFTKQMVGDLTQLQTTDKSSIVAAVNEQNVKIKNKLNTDLTDIKCIYISDTFKENEATVILKANGKTLTSQNCRLILLNGMQPGSGYTPGTPQLNSNYEWISKLMYDGQPTTIGAEITYSGIAFVDSSV